MKINTLMAGAALAMTTAFASPAALADTISFADAQQGSGACQPAREYPDLRMRQKEVDNIGTTNAYVVCSPMVHVSNGELTGMGYAFANSGDVVRTIRCTLQNDFYGSGLEIANVVREVQIDPGATGVIEFGGEDLSNPGVQLPGVQCILPGSTSLAYTVIFYVEEDLTGAPL